MKLNCIITTYNRPAKVNELIDQLVKINNESLQIIVVDSSEICNKTFKAYNNLIHIRSSHKNQPYQRYLGYKASTADILVYLDDDMEVADNEFINKLSVLFSDTELCGVAIKFKDKTDDTSLKKIPKSILFTKKNILSKFKGWISGYPELKPGKFGYCGNRGSQPVGGGSTEWVSGGAFAARRSALFRNFNFQLFDLFESKLGMGEDGIIGYSISKTGKMIYHDELLFYHNDQKDSTYSNDLYTFSRRVAFSRQFLSLEKSRLDNRKLLPARLHYHYYMFWRIMGHLINVILKPDQKRKDVLKGTFAGWGKALLFQFDKKLTRQNYWQNQVNVDFSAIDLNS